MGSSACNGKMAKSACVRHPGCCVYSGCELEAREGLPGLAHHSRFSAACTLGMVGLQLAGSMENPA